MTAPIKDFADWHLMGFVTSSPGSSLSRLPGIGEERLFAKVRFMSRNTPTSALTPIGLSATLTGMEALC
ncbi:MAG: hypothetical protein ABI809_09570 [Caldimonas sp.]